MDIKTSTLMEKIAEFRRRPIRLSGYLVYHKPDGDGILRLYPQLDPRRYYVIEKKCILHVSATAGDEHDHVTVLLEPDCEFECVTRKQMSACDLECPPPKDPCGCCPSTDPESGQLKKKDVRDFLIQIAKMLADVGFTEVDCASIDSMSADCCKLFNNLLGAVARGDSGIPEAEVMLGPCFGVV